MILYYLQCIPVLAVFLHGVCSDTSVYGDASGTSVYSDACVSSVSGVYRCLQ